MRERIAEFIEKKGVTPTEFADTVGIQRSNLSHVLSGRNNPGFSFIQKILSAYPDLDSRWLITGEGEMLLKDAPQQQTSTAQPVKILQPDLFSTISEPQPAIKPIISEKKENHRVEEKKHQKEPLKELSKETEEVNSKQNAVIHSNTIESIASKINIRKNISRVLIFYDDHTFEDYHPSE